MIRKILCWLGFHDYEIILSGDCKKVEFHYAPYTYVYFPVEMIRTTKCRCCGKIKNVEKSIIW